MLETDFSHLALDTSDSCRHAAVGDTEMQSVSAKQGYLKVPIYFRFITFMGLGGVTKVEEIQANQCVTVFKKIWWLVCNH